MDPMTIGTVAVGLLAPYMVEVGKGAAKKAGEQGVQKVEDLIAAVHGMFGRTQNQFGQQALARLEASPTNVGRQQTLVQVLDEIAEEDPTFRAELEKLTETARQDQRVIQMLRIYGNAHVGSVTTIGHAVMCISGSKGRIDQSDRGGRLWQSAAVSDDHRLGAGKHWLSNEHRKRARHLYRRG